MAIPRRGLQDIRTITGKVRKATLPHEAYLRISHIEMEKARKMVESDKARQMMADIAGRLREIGERQGAPSLRRTGPPQRRSGFKIKY